MLYCGITKYTPNGKLKFYHNWWGKFPWNNPANCALLDFPGAANSNSKLVAMMINSWLLMQAHTGWQYHKYWTDMTTIRVNRITYCKLTMWPWTNSLTISHIRCKVSHTNFSVLLHNPVELQHTCSYHSVLTLHQLQLSSNFACFMWWLRSTDLW